MWVLFLDIKEQEYFIAIAEECNLTKAAQRLFVSQPALSHFLSKLENALGIQLFNRRYNNTLSLTNAGKLYYENAQEILWIRNNFIKKLNELISDPAVKLAFGVSGEKGLDFMSQIISRLSIQYPNISVDIRFGETSKLLDLVIEGVLDLAHSAFAEKNPRLEYIEFPPFEVLILLSDTHHLSHLGATDPAKSFPRLPLKYFKNENFVLSRKNTILRYTEDCYFKKMQFTPNIKIEIYDTSSLLFILKKNHYLSLFPYELITGNKENLLFIGLDPPLYYHTGFYYSKNIYQSEVIRMSIEVAKNIVNLPINLR